MLVVRHACTVLRWMDGTVDRLVLVLWNGDGVSLLSCSQSTLVTLVLRPNDGCATVDRHGCRQVRVCWLTSLRHCSSRERCRLPYRVWLAKRYWRVRSRVSSIGYRVYRFCFHTDIRHRVSAIREPPVDGTIMNFITKKRHSCRFSARPIDGFTPDFHWDFLIRLKTCREYRRLG